MRVIEKATAKDKDEILKLYKSQLGRKYCPWNEDYPSMETIDFDLSRDALLIMREEGKIIAAISVDGATAMVFDMMPSFNENVSSPSIDTLCPDK